jgi:hypothetical protein
MHLYIGPKGVRFGPIFGKSADFSENKFEGVDPAAVRGDCHGRGMTRIVGCPLGDVRDDGEATMRGRADSISVGVAAGVMMYEVVRVFRTFE